MRTWGALVWAWRWVRPRWRGVLLAFVAWTLTVAVAWLWCTCVVPRLTPPPSPPEQTRRHVEHTARSEEASAAAVTRTQSQEHVVRHEVHTHRSPDGTQSTTEVREERGALVQIEHASAAQRVHLQERNAVELEERRNAPELRPWRVTLAAGWDVARLEPAPASVRVELTRRLGASPVSAGAWVQLHRVHGASAGLALALEW